MCKIQFDSDVKAMKIKLNGSGWFPQVTSFYLPLIGHNLLLVYYRFIKVTFTNAAFITLGAKCYYRKDLYYAWFQNLITDGTFITLAWVKMLLQKRPLLRLGPVITLVPSTPVRLARWKWKCRNDGKVFFMRVMILSILFEKRGPAACGSTWVLNILTLFQWSVRVHTMKMFFCFSNTLLKCAYCIPWTWERRVTISMFSFNNFQLLKSRNREANSHLGKKLRP